MIALETIPTPAAAAPTAQTAVAGEQGLAALFAALLAAAALDTPPVETGAAPPAEESGDPAAGEKLEEDAQPETRRAQPRPTGGADADGTPPAPASEVLPASRHGQAPWPAAVPEPPTPEPLAAEPDEAASPHRPRDGSAIPAGKQPTVAARAPRGSAPGDGSPTGGAPDDRAPADDQPSRSAPGAGTDLASQARDAQLPQSTVPQAQIGTSEQDAAPPPRRQQPLAPQLDRTSPQDTPSPARPPLRAAPPARQAPDSPGREHSPPQGRGAAAPEERSLDFPTPQAPEAASESSEHIGAPPPRTQLDDRRSGRPLRTDEEGRSGGSAPAAPTIAAPDIAAPNVAAPALASLDRLSPDRTAPAVHTATVQAATVDAAAARLALRERRVAAPMGARPLPAAEPAFALMLESSPAADGTPEAPSLPAGPEPKHPEANRLESKHLERPPAEPVPAKVEAAPAREAPRTEAPPPAAAQLQHDSRPAAAERAPQPHGKDAAAAAKPAAALMPQGADTSADPPAQAHAAAQPQSDVQPQALAAAPPEPNAPAPPARAGAGTPAEPLAPRLEAAELDPRPDRTQFRLVLNDDRLGRVSLNLTERAGLIDLMVRADRPATVRTLQDSLPALVEQLAQRNFRAEDPRYAPANGAFDPRDAAQERERRQRQNRPQPRARIRARRLAGPSPLAAE